MSATLALRVPENLKNRLQRLADKTNRSRNHHSIAAIRKYLNEAEHIEGVAERPSLYETALKYSGSGVKDGAQAKTKQEIDLLLAKMRDDN